jgi:hypothetical protein
MSGFELASAGPYFAGFIVAVLYTATYLTFVNLLRDVRNWNSTSRLEILTTGLLAILTVAAVSLSADGADLISLAISSGFIIALSFPVAAPAIAFRPANRAVEFLAKHGDYAGLWLLGPALVAGLMVPNSKLQTMLAAAMAIELSWFLRQRWAGRRRELYPLNDRDVSVLKSQANGDFKAFRRRHGIRELALTEGAVNWQGCGKSTPPCPFNLYVNQLGLNTAPCCREHMRDICHYVAACLRDIGAVHWLEGGSLLGAVREGGALLAWEDDVDLSVLLDADMSWDRLAAGLAERGARDGYHVDLFETHGLIAISFDPPKPWPFKGERNRMRGEIRVDLAIYRPAVSHGEAVLERQSYKGAMPATENGGYGLAREIVLPTSTITFEGGEIACPAKPDTYLRVLYGDFRQIEYTYVDAAAAETRRQADQDTSSKGHRN